MNYLTLSPGISYRHCLVLKDAKDGAQTTPPHDILDKNIRDYLPKGQNSELLLEMMNVHDELLKDHPVNKSRMERGLPPVSSVWFWGKEESQI